jgi:hypothetical protein
MVEVVQTYVLYLAHWIDVLGAVVGVWAVLMALGKTFSSWQQDRFGVIFSHFMRQMTIYGLLSLEFFIVATFFKCLMIHQPALFLEFLGLLALRYVMTQALDKVLRAQKQDATLSVAPLFEKN